jgi:hypothetical protein
MNVSFAEAVRVMLNNDAPFAAAVPGNIAPSQIPQSNTTWPAADYSNLSGDGFSSIAGQDDGVAQCSLDLRVICETVAQVKAAEAAVKAVIRANPVRKVVGSNTLYALQFGTSTMSEEDLSDGNDEPFYVLTIPISGWVT